MWDQIRQSLHQSVERVFTKVAMLLPGILAFFLALLIFLAVAWLAAYLVRRILVAVRFDERLHLQRSALIEWSPSQTPTLIASRVVFWACLLAGVVVGLSAFEAASAESLLAGYLLAYLPRLVGAVLILLVGNVVAPRLIASRVNASDHGRSGAAAIRSVSGCNSARGEPAARNICARATG